MGFLADHTGYFRGGGAGPKTWKSYFGGDEDGETEQAGKESDTESGSGTGDGSDHIQQAPEDNGGHQEGTTTQTSEPEGSGEPEDDGGADGKESADIEQETEKGAGRDYGAADKPGTAEAEDDAPGEESGEGDCEETAGGQTAEPGGTESQREEIAPAQKSPEILEREADPEPKFDAMNEPEIVEKPFGSRKDWLDTLTAYGMAVEMAKM